MSAWPSEAEIRKYRTETRLQESEINSLYSTFITRYPDGKISKRQFKKIIKNGYGGWDEANPSEYAEHLFRAYDADKDGYINFEEYLLNVHMLLNGGKDQKAKVLYRLCDVDGNGVSERTLGIILHAKAKAEGHVGNNAYSRQEAKQELDAKQKDLFKRLCQNNSNAVLLNYNAFCSGMWDPYIALFLEPGSDHPDLLAEPKKKSCSLF